VIRADDLFKAGEVAGVDKYVNCVGDRDRDHRKHDWNAETANL